MPLLPYSRAWQGLSLVRMENTDSKRAEHRPNKATAIILIIEEGQDSALVEHGFGIGTPSL